MRVPPRLIQLIAVVATLRAAPGCRSASPPPGPAAGAVIAPAAERAAAMPQPGAPSRGAVAPRRFGAPLAEGSASLPLASVLAKPDDFASRTVTIEAKVRRNCTRRGCWMELSEALDPSLPGCRVTFKDYGFFVPLDSAGSTAKVQGTVEVQAVSAAEVAHLEGEGAKFVGKQADGSAREVRMVATGVELWRTPG